jgi:hypothetical protein
MRQNVETRRMGDAGPRELSCVAADSPENKLSRIAKQARARRELTNAAAKLAALSEWHALHCECKAPALLNNIVEQVWRAVAALSVEARP